MTSSDRHSQANNFSLPFLETPVDIQAEIQQEQSSHGSQHSDNRQTNREKNTADELSRQEIMTEVTRGETTDAKRGKKRGSYRKKQKPTHEDDYEQGKAEGGGSIRAQGGGFIRAGSGGSRKSRRKVTGVSPLSACTTATAHNTLLALGDTPNRQLLKSVRKPGMTPQSLLPNDMTASEFSWWHVLTHYVQKPKRSQAATSPLTPD